MVKEAENRLQQKGVQIRTIAIRLLMPLAGDALLTLLKNVKKLL